MIDFCMVVIPWRNPVFASGLVSQVVKKRDHTSMPLALQALQIGTLMVLWRTSTCVFAPVFGFRIGWLNVFDQASGSSRRSCGFLGTQLQLRLRQKLGFATIRDFSVTNLRLCRISCSVNGENQNIFADNMMNPIRNAYVFVFASASTS
jgi:hypothetical protein